MHTPLRIHTTTHVHTLLTHMNAPHSRKGSCKQTLDGTSTDVPSCSSLTHCWNGKKNGLDNSPGGPPAVRARAHTHTCRHTHPHAFHAFPHTNRHAYPHTNRQTHTHPNN
jgi:hypothetical protein